MVEEARSQRVEDLKKELSILEGAPTYREWELLHVVYSAYIVNAGNLVALVTSPEHDPELMLDLMDADPTAETPRQFQQELLRLLINYGATVSTLVDHSRSFFRRYSGIKPELVREYEDRTRRVTALDVAHFVQGLRNYLLHYRLPPITRSLSFTREPNNLSFAIRLDCAVLSAWDGWRAQAKSYLQGRESVVLLDAVQDYTSAIQDLYSWIFSQAQDTAQETAVRKMAVQTQLVHVTEGSQQE